MRKSRMRKDQVVMIECAFICVSELAVVVEMKIHVEREDGCQQHW